MESLSKTLTDLLTVKHKGCIIHKDTYNNYRWVSKVGSLEEVKKYIDQVQHLTKIAEGVYVGEDHPLHPNNLK